METGGSEAAIGGWIGVTTSGDNAGVGVESVGAAAGSWVAAAKGGDVGDDFVNVGAGEG